MKKIVMTAALAAFTLAASAQSLNVSSAFQDMRKGYLNKAKAEIDAACLHESTKDDAKTWCYKALIYSQIGGDAQNKKPKFKNLAPDWAEQAYTAALECKRLDTKQEFAQQVNEVFSFVGNEYYKQAAADYQEKNYAQAIELAEKSITSFNNSGKSQFAQDAMYIAGLSSVATHDTVNVKKYFNNMIRKRTDINFVYTTLFNIYKAEKDNANAMKVANNYAKNCKNDYRAYILMAEGYLNDKNIEKGKEQINTVLEMTKDSADLYPMVLVLAGGLLDESAGDYEGAMAKYNESLTLKPNQFEANFGLGKMVYNRAVDKTNAANAVDPFDEEKAGLYEKLNEEAKGFYSQSITYLEKAVAYIDGLSDEGAKASQRPNLVNALVALGNAYARVDKLNESNAAKARVEQLMKQ
ncbi:MAG: tetratricopeptide repeat protein [Bacteroidales bacterium]|nr:tetratricopeptide repeat protein [Bacteroidales bacterium]